MYVCILVVFLFRLLWRNKQLCIQSVEQYRDIVVCMFYKEICISVVIWSVREGVNHVFNDGLGLLHMACLSQNFAAVECLVTAGVDTNIRDTQGQPTSLDSC